MAQPQTNLELSFPLCTSPRQHASEAVSDQTEFYFPSGSISSHRLQNSRQPFYPPYSPWRTSGEASNTFFSCRLCCFCFFTACSNGTMIPCRLRSPTSTSSPSTLTFDSNTRRLPRTGTTTRQSKESRWEQGRASRVNLCTSRRRRKSWAARFSRKTSTTDW